MGDSQQVAAGPFAVDNYSLSRAKSPCLKAGMRGLIELVLEVKDLERSLVSARSIASLPGPLYHTARPHQGLGQRTPIPGAHVESESDNSSSHPYRSHGRPNTRVRSGEVGVIVASSLLTPRGRQLMLTLSARRALVVLAGLVSLLACGGSQGASSSSNPSPSPSPSPVLLTAAQVVTKLQAGGMPVGQITVFTAASDQNNLLGRPHQYTGKATWVDTSLAAPFDPTDIDAGGSVEVFALVGDLQTRSQYIANIAKVPLFAEYDYISTAGLVLLRLSGKLTPDQAQKYVTVVKQFLPDLVAVSV